jgi:pyruvate kinase
MRRHRRVKIIATLGPASSDPAMIARLFEAGADLFRINMSHLDRGKLAAQVETIRAVEKRFNRPIGILVDLQGPKLRVGTFAKDKAELKVGDRFILDGKATPGDADRVHLPHPEILAALEPGHAILIDDGKLKLIVEEVGAGQAVTRVVVGGIISNRKGVSLPDTTIPVSAMTPKDRSDLEAAVEIGVDWIALSFVQRPEDVAEARKVTRGRALIMAKLEKPQAIARLDEIMEVSDALMVARGDLGVELPLETVPGIQKRITRNARRLGKPVVIATQMLESMITAPVPTRAEVSDVATAVFEGADAVMLSAESAAGQFPVEAVATMNRIAEEVEADSHYRAILDARGRPEAMAPTPSPPPPTGRRPLRRRLGSWPGPFPAQRRGGARAANSAGALTPNRDTARRLTLVWGVHALVTRDAHDIDDMVARACKFAAREGFATPGERIITVAGMPFGTPGATNMVRIAFIGPDSQGESR